MTIRSVYLLAAISLFALLAAAVQFILTPARANAQASPGVDIRLAARENHDGSVSVGLQYRLDGSWRPVTPTRNRLPATAQPGRWHVTNALDIEVTQAQVKISMLDPAWSDEEGGNQFIVAVDATRLRARCGILHLELSDDGLIMYTGVPDCEDTVVFGERQLANPTGVGSVPIRLGARRVGGGVELGLQRLAQGRWEALRQPSNPLLRDTPQGRWRFSDAFGLPALPPDVFGQLRRGATIKTRDGEFVLDIDGQTYHTHCGVLDLEIATQSILVDTSTADCHGSIPLLTLCPTSDCDEQQNAAYWWEARPASALEAIELTLPQARAVVNALFADYFPLNTPPSVSFSRYQSHGHASNREIVLGTNVQDLRSTVHELAHTLVAQSGTRDAGHGGAFTAMLLDIWERYFPIVDISAARAAAQRAGIEIASRAPAQAVRDRGTGVLNDLFCGPQPVSAELCQSFAGSMTATEESVAGLYVGGGRSGRLTWGAYVDDGGELLSFANANTNIDASEREAVLSVQCQDRGMKIGLYWAVGRDLDWTVRYRVDDGGWHSAEWNSGRGSWGNTEYKWTGLQRADNLIVELARAAQSGGTFTAEVHERNNANGRYTATWRLNRLFNTPIQPNLAHCRR